MQDPHGASGFPLNARKPLSFVSSRYVLYLESTRFILNADRSSRDDIHLYVYVRPLHVVKYSAAMLPFTGSRMFRKTKSSQKCTEQLRPDRGVICGKVDGIFSVCKATACADPLRAPSSLVPTLSADCKVA